MGCDGVEAGGGDAGGTDSRVMVVVRDDGSKG